MHRVLDITAAEGIFLIGMCEIQSCTDASHLSDQKYNSDIHDENPVDRLNQSRHTPDGNFGM